MHTVDRIVLDEVRPYRYPVIVSDLPNDTDIEIRQAASLAYAEWYADNAVPGDVAPLQVVPHPLFDASIFWLDQTCSVFDDPNDSIFLDFDLGTLPSVQEVNEGDEGEKTKEEMILEVPGVTEEGPATPVVPGQEGSGPGT